MSNRWIKLDSHVPECAGYDDAQDLADWFFDFEETDPNLVQWFKQWLQTLAPGRVYPLRDGYSVVKVFNTQHDTVDLVDHLKAKMERWGHIDEWEFERSSGYAGWRNTISGIWIYQEEFEELSQLAPNE